MTTSEALLARAEQLLQRVESILPAAPPPLEWTAPGYVWRHQGTHGYLKPVHALSNSHLQDLLCIDDQKQQIDTNTRQFIAGLPANNVLLWGPRGTGKSSLIKALLNAYKDRGLRLIEIERQHLTDLPDIIDRIANRKERFVLYCDDLSFERSDDSYKALKVLLDGTIQAAPGNMLVYATSNRRHLLPERQADNLDAQIIDGELHQSEAVEERIALSERFGMWLAFHPFSQDQYLQIVEHWLTKLAVRKSDRDGAERAALQWALLHGSRSGRSAWQFAKDWAGRSGLRRSRRK